MACLMPSAAVAEPAFWFGLGSGGEFDETSLSIGGRSGDWGFNLAFVFSSEYAEDDIFDYRTPHNDYRIVSEDAYIGNPAGVDIFRFFNITENQSILIGAGLYLATQCDVAQSNATGWLYCESEKDASIGSISAGYQVNILEASAILAYHTARGAEVIVGHKF